MKKLVRENLNENYYYRARKAPTINITEDHAGELTVDIAKWLKNDEIEINSIYAMDQGEGDWWIDVIWYDWNWDADEKPKRPKVKHAYLTCPPSHYQHTPKLEYASHGFPVMAKEIYMNPNID